MKPMPIPTAAACALALAACGESRAPAPENAGLAARQSAEEAADRVYSATGGVTEIAGDRVTIAHGPVEAIGWPAMTMTFKAASPEMAREIGVGDFVSFEFRRTGHEYELTSLSKPR